MEEFGNAAASVGIWTGYIVWIVLMFVAPFVIFVGLPGGWIALGLAVIYDLAWGFTAIGWPWLLVFLGLMLLGEGIEAVLGTVYVAAKGATRYGVLGAFIGGLAGAVAGSGVVPVVGTVLGSFLGAFVGAVIGEYIRDERLEPSVRIGFHAVIGKVLASSVKFALAIAGCALVAVKAWPGA